MRSQTTAIGVCACLGMVFWTTALAEKTTVAVDKGQVRAKTSGGEVMVAAGQKAVMMPDKKPLAGVNEPMVDDLIALSKWINTERESKRLRIDSASIQIVAIESDKRFKAAFLNESLNKSDAPTTTDHINNMSGAIEPRFYDLNGRLLQYDVKKKDNDRAAYTIHLVEAVPSGAYTRHICVTDLRAPQQCLSTDGIIWRVWSSDGSPNCLNYFRFVLPKSAILIDTSNRPVLVDNSDGRVAVTLRNYTGEDTGAVHLLFLWPERDGTSLDDVPAEYRGGQDAWKASMQDQYREQMARIKAGQDYNDQSTPLATLLSTNAALIRNDRERLINMEYDPEDPRHEKADYELARIEEALGGLQGVRELIVDTIDLVSAPPWPKNPHEGATYQIDKYGKGSQVRNWTTGFIFHNGKWWWAWNRPGPGLPTDDAWIREHAQSRPTSGANAERRAELTREYQARMERIRNGANYNDQSTPLATLLTRNAAIIRNNHELLVGLIYDAKDPKSKAADLELKEIEKVLGGMQGVSELIVDTIEEVNASPWPEKPSEGDTCEIKSYAKGGQLILWTTGFVFHDGKWYQNYNQPGPGLPSEDDWIKNHSKEASKTSSGK